MIPRDIVCWYCRHEEHSRCPLPNVCACRACYAEEMQQQAEKNKEA